jgi:hypothetical protein
MTSGGFQLPVTAPSVEVQWRIHIVCPGKAGRAEHFYQIPIDGPTGGRLPVTTPACDRTPATQGVDRWRRSAHPERRCTAHRKNGERCKNAARLGTNVCDYHGAKAPQVKRKARQRIEEAADRLACELLKMATDGNVADSVKLAAIKDALDRAGLAAKSAVEVEVSPPKPYEAILEGIEAGSRAEYRRSIGR